MQIRNARDFGSGLMFIAVGTVFAVGALNYPMGSSARPGAGYFPLGLGVLMALLGLAVLVQSLTRGEPGADPIGAVAWRPLLVVTAAIVFFGLALPGLGLLVTAPLLIAGVSLAGDEFGWKGVLITSAVLTLGCWLVFIKGLALVIPVLPAFLS